MEQHQKPKEEKLASWMGDTIIKQLAQIKHDLEILEQQKKKRMAAA